MSTTFANKALSQIKTRVYYMYPKMLEEAAPSALPTIAPASSDVRMHYANDYFGTCTVRVGVVKTPKGSVCTVWIVEDGVSDCYHIHTSDDLKHVIGVLDTLCSVHAA